MANYSYPQQNLFHSGLFTSREPTGARDSAPRHKQKITSGVDPRSKTHTVTPPLPTHQIILESVIAGGGGCECVWCCAMRAIDEVAGPFNPITKTCKTHSVAFLDAIRSDLSSAIQMARENHAVIGIDMKVSAMCHMLCWLADTGASIPKDIFALTMEYAILRLGIVALVDDGSNQARQDKEIQETFVTTFGDVQTPNRQRGEAIPTKVVKVPSSILIPKAIPANAASVSTTSQNVCTAPFSGKSDHKPDIDSEDDCSSNETSSESDGSSDSDDGASSDSGSFDSGTDMQWIVQAWSKSRVVFAMHQTPISTCDWRSSLNSISHVAFKVVLEIVRANVVLEMLVCGEMNLVRAIALSEALAIERPWIIAASLSTAIDAASHTRNSDLVDSIVGWHSSTIAKVLMNTTVCVCAIAEVIAALQIASSVSATARHMLIGAFSRTCDSLAWGCGLEPPYDIRNGDSSCGHRSSFVVHDECDCRSAEVVSAICTATSHVVDWFASKNTPIPCFMVHATKRGLSLFSSEWVANRKHTLIGKSICNVARSLINAILTVGVADTATFDAQLEWDDVASASDMFTAMGPPVHSGKQPTQCCLENAVDPLGPFCTPNLETSTLGPSDDGITLVHGSDSKTHMMVLLLCDAAISLATAITTRCCKEHGVRTSLKGVKCYTRQRDRTLPSYKKQKCVKKIMEAAVNACIGHCMHTDNAIESVTRLLNGCGFIAYEAILTISEPTSRPVLLAVHWAVSTINPEIAAIACGVDTDIAKTDLVHQEWIQQLRSGVVDRTQMCGVEISSSHGVAQSVAATAQVCSDKSISIHQREDENKPSDSGWLKKMVNGVFGVFSTPRVVTISDDSNDDDSENETVDVEKQHDPMKHEKLRCVLTVSSRGVDHVKHYHAGSCSDCLAVAVSDVVRSLMSHPSKILGVAADLEHGSAGVLDTKAASVLHALIIGCTEATSNRTILLSSENVSDNEISCTCEFAPTPLDIAASVFMGTGDLAGVRPCITHDMWTSIVDHPPNDFDTGITIVSVARVAASRLKADAKAHLKASDAIFAFCARTACVFSDEVTAESLLEFFLGNVSPEHAKVTPYMAVCAVACASSIICGRLAELTGQYHDKHATRDPLHTKDDQKQKHIHKMADDEFTGCIDIVNGKMRSLVETLDAATTLVTSDAYARAIVGCVAPVLVWGVESIRVVNTDDLTLIARTFSVMLGRVSASFKSSIEGAAVSQLINRAASVDNKPITLHSILISAQASMTE